MSNHPAPEITDPEYIRARAAMAEDANALVDLLFRQIEMRLGNAAYYGKYAAAKNRHFENPQEFLAQLVLELAQERI